MRMLQVELALLQGQAYIGCAGQPTHHGGCMDNTALQKVIADLYRHIALLQETVQQMERHSIADTEALLQRVRELEGQL